MTTKKSHDVVAKLILQRFCNMYFLGKTFKHTNACMFEARMHVCCFVILLSPISGVILRELHIMKQIINSKLLIVWFLNRFWRICRFCQELTTGGGGVQMKNVPSIFGKDTIKARFSVLGTAHFSARDLKSLNNSCAVQVCDTDNAAKFPSWNWEMFYM